MRRLLLDNPCDQQRLKEDELESSSLFVSIFNYHNDVGLSSSLQDAKQAFIDLYSTSHQPKLVG